MSAYLCSGLTTALTSYLSVHTGVDVSRLSINVTDAQSDGDTTLLPVFATITVAVYDVDKSALEGASDFVAAWTDTSSVAYDSSGWPFQLDPSFEPAIQVLDGKDGLSSSSGPAPFTPAPTPVVPLHVTEPQDASSSEDGSASAANASPAEGETHTKRQLSDALSDVVGEHRWGTMQALVMKRLLDATRGRPTFSSFALLPAAMGIGVFTFLALWMWRAGSRTSKTSKRKAARVQPITSGILAADK